MRVLVGATGGGGFGEVIGGAFSGGALVDGLAELSCNMLNSTRASRELGGGGVRLSGTTKSFDKFASELSVKKFMVLGGRGGAGLTVIAGGAVRTLFWPVGGGGGTLFWTVGGGGLFWLVGGGLRVRTLLWPDGGGIRVCTEVDH